MASSWRRPGPPKCQFCGAELADPMIAFMEHLDQNPPCKTLWLEWRENIHRETGGT